MARSKYEVKTQKQLEESGWVCDYKIRPGRRMRAGMYTPDYFGLFDIMAQKDGALRMISVKGHAGVPSEHAQAIADFQLPEGVSKEIWVYTRSGKVNIIEI